MISAFFFLTHRDVGSFLPLDIHRMCRMRGLRDVLEIMIKRCGRDLNRE